MIEPNYKELFSHIANMLWVSNMGYTTTLFYLSLCLFIPLYLLLPSEKMRRNCVLVSSSIFYIWNGVGAFVIVIGTAFTIYLTTMAIEKEYLAFDEEKVDLSPKEQAALLTVYKKKTLRHVRLSLLIVLGIWIFVKVSRFNEMVPVEYLREFSFGLNVIVPLGISYYTLSSVGYLLDVYWRKAKVEYNFFHLFTAMIYFPQITIGPIGKYSKLIPQLTHLPPPNYNRVCFGLQLMLWGYIKKLIVADRLILYTSTVYADPTSFAGVEIVIAALLGVVHIYADFSGCIDIIRGISQIIGVNLEQNFRQPFFAQSAQEFWSRWHMTLGGWTKEYIYLPIAMNSKFLSYLRTVKKEHSPWVASFVKSLTPLVVVWCFTGLWHGTGMDYLLWGLYWCSLMTIAKEAKPLHNWMLETLKIDSERTYYKCWSMIRTTAFFAIGRMITATGETWSLITLFTQLFTEHRLWTFFDDSLFTHGLDFKDFTVALVFMIVMFFVDVLHEKNISIRETLASQILPIRWCVYYGAIMALIIFGMYGPSVNPADFVYGAF